MAEAPARRVTRSASRASSASSDGVAGAAAGDATATSGHAPRFRGVTCTGGKFAAAIKHAKQTHKLGLFDTAEEAARAFDRAAFSLLGAELAARKLNFPAELADLDASIGPDAPPFLAAVPEDDCGYAATDDEPDALGTLAASMHRFLSASSGPSCWIPAVQLPPPLVLGVGKCAAVPVAPTITESGTLLNPPHATAAAVARAAMRRAGSSDSGPGWFNLAAPAVTLDLKRDLRLLRLRGAFDPKRFYKSADSGKLPEHFAIGTVVEDASDYYSARLSQAARKGSLAEELLSDDGVAEFRKRKAAALAKSAAARGKGWHSATKGKPAARHAKRRGRA